MKDMSRHVVPRDIRKLETRTSCSHNILTSRGEDLRVDLAPSLPVSSVCP